jgi:hypothetical protein
VNSNLARVRQCCAAIRHLGKSGTSPDGTFMMNVAMQCDIAASQAGPRQTPDMNGVRQMMRGRVMPAACAGM